VDLLNKTVLITGANRGLGFELVKYYLSKGYTVFGAARNTDKHTLTDIKRQYDEDLQLIQMDVASEESVTQAVAEIRSRTSSIDIIINNAAVHLEKDYVEDLDLEKVSKILEVNALGPLRVVKSFLNLLEHSANGVIVNITSESGSIGDAKREKEFGYCMSKAALNMQSKLLQNYMIPKKIKVLAIHPGWMRTDMGGQNAHMAADEAAQSIARLIDERSKDYEGEIFMDYTGKLMNW
jgi:NAD(P)-dependent dehydrogenase (short-subunit alcohol dehydrogenase family)